jgi:hypothetical protein
MRSARTPIVEWSGDRGGSRWDWGGGQRQLCSHFSRDQVMQKLSNPGNGENRMALIVDGIGFIQGLKHKPRSVTFDNWQP